MVKATWPLAVKKRSSDRALYESFDEGHSTVSVFLDLSKAFDSLNRSILLKKLDYYEIQGKELDWFKSYFSERKQLVNYKGVRSEAMTTINSGSLKVVWLGSFCFAFLLMI